MLLLQIFTIILTILIKKHDNLVNHPTIKTCINKIKNRIVLKIKAGFKPEFQIPETTNLLGTTDKDISKNKNGEKCSRT